MASSKTFQDYVVCIEDGGYEVSLERRKIYRRLSDPEAESQGFLRIVDETGEDYLFPAEHFVSVTLPEEALEALAGVA